MLYTILLTILLAIICTIISGSIITRATIQLKMKTKLKDDSQTLTLESESDCDFDDVPQGPISKHEFLETASGSNPVQGKSPTATVGQLLDTTRPEFIPINVPFLCKTTPYDNLGFWDFPSRKSWKVKREDRWCHSGCPPGTCTTRGYKEAFEAPYGLACPAVIKEGASSTPTPTREKIAFLQAWLFFGALDEICTLCGLDLDVTKIFVVEGMVTTEPLNGLPGRLYRASVLQRSDLVPKSFMLELQRVARHVQLIITRRTLDDEHEYTFEECLVLSSINILLRTILMTALHYLPSWKISGEAKPILCLADVGWLPEGQRTMQFLLKKQPLPRGWCSASELDGLNHDSKFFAYFLERPHAHRDHSKCTGTKCLASQTDANTYRTTHVSDGCNCSFIAVDPEQLKDSLERNQIPKITVSLDPDDAAGTIALTVIDGEKLPYIAISHVWADGLGNPRENSLPRCQLLRLRDLINNLGNIIHQNHKETHLAFWIDTLCIPVAPHLKDYRRLAIHQIRETFRDATATLVLDKELYNLDTRVISNMEIGIRIFSGGWIKRIWTLKEAVYTLATGDSEKLFFQMKEDLVEWNRERSRFIYHPGDLPHKDKPTFIQDENDLQGFKYTVDGLTVDDLRLEILFEAYLETAMESRLPPLDSLVDSDPDEPQFLKLADAVSRRSTSKQEDEPLCLTFLLDRTVPNLLKTQDVEERMAMFYLELGKIPKAILFEDVLDESKPEPWIKATLLQKSPFRWAPASLASLPVGRLVGIRVVHDSLLLADKDYHGLGTCKRDGLHIHNDGFLVTGQENRLSQPSSFLEDIDTGENYKLVYCKEPPYGYYREIGILFQESLEHSNSVAILQIEKKKKDTCR